MDTPKLTARPAMAEARIDLPSNSTIGMVEEAFDQFGLKYSNTRISKLVISFADVVWLDVSTMMFLVSVTYKRHRENLQTRFILPSADNSYRTSVLIILHTWRFFEVLKEITLVNMREFLLNPESFEHILTFKYKEKSEGTHEEVVEVNKGYMNLTKDYFEKFYKYNEGLKTMQFDKQFFPLISNPFNTLGEKLTTLNDMMHQWDKGSLIVSVLTQILNTPQKIDGESGMIVPRPVTVRNKLSNDIIKESVTNCIRHPNADLLITGSYFDIQGKMFTIVIWDNGDSIISSLRAGLAKNGTIKSTVLAAVDDDILNPAYFVTDGKEDNRNLDSLNLDEKLFFSTDIPTLDDPDWRFLLASLYPRVTSKPQSGPAFLSLGEEDSSNATFDGTGMGLTVILDSVIKYFDGQVIARVDGCAAKIKRAEAQHLHAIYRKKKNEILLYPLENRYKKDKIDTSDYQKKSNFVYQVKIEDKSKAPFFTGNMLTIKIPLRARS